MKNTSYRDTWVEVSLGHIQDNLGEFKKQVQRRTKIMAVVKADGYGHGAVEVAKASITAGANYLGVALLDEALQLREAGITHPILILGYTPVRSIQRAISNNITITVFTEDVLDEIIRQSIILQTEAFIHLKIDTGMSRVGVTTKEEALILARKAIASSKVNVEGLFTHFANADSLDSFYTDEQFKRFLAVIDYLEKNEIQIPLKHCCNSTATIKFPHMHLDMVRIGIALYGLYPDASLKGQPIKLKQSMSLKTKIAAIKKVPAFQPVSYGCTWEQEKDSTIATLPLGYADGLSRLLSNRGTVLTHGQKCAIVGRVCMDQTMIDVSELKNCSHGDEVTIFGWDHSSFQSVDEIANLMSTINYEVVCIIGKRVPRVYLNDDHLNQELPEGVKEVSI